MAKGGGGIPLEEAGRSALCLQRRVGGSVLEKKNYKLAVKRVILITVTI